MRAVWLFSARQMLPESAELFNRRDVVLGGKTLGSFQDPAEAEQLAEQHSGARIGHAFRVPTRVVVELLG
ncbi:hypothetical protein C9J60_08380 [Streptomyces sp. A244]|nr:hypothetical protein C9J60_08380 [Streptomyces sp. A244]